MSYRGEGILFSWLVGRIRGAGGHVGKQGWSYDLWKGAGGGDQG